MPTEMIAVSSKTVLNSGQQYDNRERSTFDAGNMLLRY